MGHTPYALSVTSISYRHYFFKLLAKHDTSVLASIA